MPFSLRDLTAQYISLSYQDVVQRYNPGGSASYYLDGLGNELFTLPSTYIGQQVLTVGQSASYSIASLTSISSSYALTSEFSDTASISVFSDFSDTASVALFVVSSSHAQTASFALNAGSPIITGSTYPITSSWSNNSISTSIASIATSIDFVPQTSISSSWSSQSISASYSPVEPTYSASNSSVKQNTLIAGGLYFITSSWANNTQQSVSSSYALTASFAVTASYEIEIEFSSSWASQSLSSSHALSSDNTYAISFVPETVKSASWVSASVYVVNADTASFVSGNNVFGIVQSSSYAISTSYSPIEPTFSASNATVKQNVLVTGSTHFITSSWSDNSQTASYLDGTSSFTISSSYSLTSSYVSGFIFNNTSSIVETSQSNVVVSIKETGSYTAAFFDYVISSGSNSRAGTLFGHWNNSSIVYTHYSTTDIGDTSLAIISMDISNSYVRLLSNVPSNTWNVKVLGRYL